MNEQIPYTNSLASIQIASNPEPRCACALVLDISGSMSGDAIAELNEAVQCLINDLAAEALASKRVEISVVTFGESVELVSDFTSPRQLVIPKLEAGGGTPMGEAVVKAASVLEARKEEYKRAGLQYFRPWMFLITDGEPTDEDSAYWREAVRIVHDGDSKGRLLFFGVAVGGANQVRLDQLCPPKRPSQKLRGLRFREMFLWLTRTLTSVSSLNPGQTVQLPSTNGWSQIDA